MKRNELLILVFLGIVIAFSLVPLCNDNALAQEKIKVGSIMDLTGPANANGVPLSEGIADYIEKINKEGGIKGRKIDYYAVDYEYKLPLAMAAYKRLVTQENVIAIFGFGTGDSKARIPLANTDKIPQVYTSLAEDLTDPFTTYCFSALISYTHQVMGMLKYAKEHPVVKGRKVRVAYVYSDAEYGRSPIRKLKERNYTEKLGLELVDEEILSEIATEAISQALTLKKSGPDYTILVLTPRPASVFIKDAKKVGIETKFMGFSPTSSINLLGLLGDIAEGVMGALPWSQWHEMNVPGIQRVWEYNKKYHPDRKALDIYYICGWLHGMIFEEAVKRASGNLTGEGIKNALETFTNFQTEGIAPPITFSKTDHRGSYMVKIGLANTQKGTFEPITNWIGVEK